jgi:steroid delta-isomerase-like uncharacterized protein
MNPEQNKAQKLRYVAALSSADLDAIGQLVAPEYVLHVAGSPDIEGPEMLKAMVAGSLAALSDVKLTADDMVAEGDKVATRWTMTATHSGEFMGVPATGKRLTIHGVIIDRFVGGRVVEAWENFDMFGLMQQLRPSAPAPDAR